MGVVRSTFVPVLVVALLVVGNPIQTYAADEPPPSLTFQGQPLSRIVSGSSIDLTDYVTQRGAVTFAQEPPPTGPSARVWGTVIIVGVAAFFTTYYLACRGKDDGGACGLWN